MTDPAALLLVARALLFAATAQLAGALFFDLSVAPLPRDRRVMLWCPWAMALAAAGLWLVSQAALFSHRPLGGVFGSGVLWITITRTRFGHVMATELALSFLTALAMVAAALLRWRPAPPAIAPAAGMLGALAWIGHGADGHGIAGAVHLGADVLHLLAMGAWLGGLLPFAMLIAAPPPASDGESAAALRRAIWCFSSRCLWAVALMTAGGIVNAWFLVGSLAGFVETDYGRVLLVKIGMFLAMFALATVNREILIPRLAGPLPGRLRETLPPLRRNTAIIGLLAILVIAIVALLGTLPPAVGGHG
jgi:putative copper resistance protein D